LSSRTVGSMARSRVSSVTLAPSIGTLRSTRTSTRLPVSSSGRSSRVLKLFMLVLRDAASTGSAAPQDERNISEPAHGEEGLSKRSASKTRLEPLQLKFGHHAGGVD